MGIKKKIQLDLPDTVKTLIDKKIAARDAAQKSKVHLSITSRVDERTKSQLSCKDLVLDTKKGKFTDESLGNCEISMVYKDEDKEKTIKASGIVKFDGQSSLPENSTELESVPLKSDSEDIRKASLRIKTQLTDEIISEIYCPDVSVDTINDQVDQESLKDCQTRLIALEKGELESKSNPILGAIKFSNPVDKNNDDNDVEKKIDDDVDEGDDLQ